MTRHEVIAIDGPAASGKSTVGRMLALELGYRFLDTGVMYRAATLACMNAKIDLLDAREVARVAIAAKIDLVECEGSDQVWLDGRDVTAPIHAPDVTANVRHIAGLPDVRAALVQAQRQLAEAGPLVAAGRDVCTVVFRESKRKFYLDASAEVRARRRSQELNEQGRTDGETEVLAAIRRRDEADSAREASPLRVADDAEVIDTSERTTLEVVKVLLEKVRAPAG